VNRVDNVNHIVSAATSVFTTFAVFEPETVTPLDLAETVTRSALLGVLTWEAGSGVGSTPAPGADVHGGDQLVLVLGLQQVVDSSRRKRRERLIGGSKDRDVRVVASASASPATSAAASSVSNVPTDLAVATT
jgi:hypothetical protein